MRHICRQVCFGLCISSLLFLMPRGTLAQGYPTKPIRLIVSFPAGGPTDIMARTMSQKLSESLGQSIVVENKLGAGGNIGADAAAKAAPDGYTLYFGSLSQMAISPALYPKLPFDPVKDFAPIGLVGQLPLFLVVPVNLPVHSLKDLIALAKSKPGRLTYAASISGGTTHLVWELFKSASGVNMKHIPYKGTAIAIPDLLSGNVDALIDALVTTAPHVEAGKLRFIAVTTAKRSTLVPNVPTIAESGFPGFEAISWSGLFAPAGTPGEIIQKLSTELAKVMALPEVLKRFATLGMEPLASSSPEQFSAFMRSEAIKWAKTIRDAKVKVEE